MKRIVAFAFCLLFFSLIFTEDVIEREFEVSEGKMLDINLKSSGSIRIFGWPQKRMKVKVTFKKGRSSDYDFEGRKTDSWINDGLASPRKIIYGKGRINGGLNPVRIRTWNGDVHLKKNEGA